MMLLTQEQHDNRELEVVRDLYLNPVKWTRRSDLPMYTNISVDQYYNKFSTYSMRELVLKALPDLNIGLASYIAQCLVNPMFEAHFETKTNVCDLTMVFGYDFEDSDGSVHTAEEIQNALFPLFEINSESTRNIDMSFAVSMETLM